MYSHLSHDQEVLNATMVSLVWNELARHKVNGQGKLKPPSSKGKLRKKGQLAPMRQPRPNVMNVHTNLFGEEVSWWCSHNDAKLLALRQSRKDKEAARRAERDDTLAGVTTTKELRDIEAVQRSREGAMVPLFRPILGVYAKIPALLRRARAFLYRPPWPLEYPAGTTPAVIDLVATADDAAHADDDDDRASIGSVEENFEDLHEDSPEDNMQESDEEEELQDGLPGV